jgi:hypothetical protein
LVWPVPNTWNKMAVGGGGKLLNHVVQDGDWLPAACFTGGLDMYRLTQSPVNLYTACVFTALYIFSCCPIKDWI